MDLNPLTMSLLFFVFVLAMLLGTELIRKVPSQLHTPLMSGSNAISGISIVGALIAAGRQDSEIVVTVLGTLAIAFAMINVVGGYFVTDRMLKMFKGKGKGGEK
jgi:NAD(P) transhydrogenase subunit alpha